MLLSPTERTFTGEVENIGTFTFKYPRLTDDLEIDAKSAQLLSENPNPSVYASNVAYQMATLSLVTVKAPKGWDLNNLYSYKELDAVYRVYLQEIQRFRGNNVSERTTPPCK
jgi:hypothetical protein